MGKSSLPTYNTLERAYNDFMTRSEVQDAVSSSGSASYGSGGGAMSSMSQSSSSSSIAGLTSGADVAEETIAGGLKDIYVQNFIKSANYKPRRSGFYLDGNTGKAYFIDGYFIRGYLGYITIDNGGAIQSADYVAGQSGFLMTSAKNQALVDDSLITYYNFEDTTNNSIISDLTSKKNNAQIFTRNIVPSIATNGIKCHRYAPYTGLVAYYKFQDTGVDEISGTPGIMAGSPSFVDDGFDGTMAGTRAINFQNGQYLDISSTDPIVLSSNETTTISAWIKFPLPTTGDGWRTVCRGTDSGHHIIFDSAGNLGMYNGLGFNNSGFNSNTLTGWHNVTSIIYHTQNKQRFYVDNGQVGEVNSSLNNTIGTIGNYGGGGQNIGIMKDFKVYNRALSLQEIQNITALSGDGYVFCPDENKITNFASDDNYSISIWFRSSLRADQSISEHWQAGGGYGWVLRGPNGINGHIAFGLFDGLNNPVIGVSDKNYADNQWHHLVGVRNGVDKMLYFYVDGVLKGSMIDNTTSALSIQDGFCIGARSISTQDITTGIASNCFDGDIDEFRIYNIALSQADVTQLYNYPGRPYDKSYIEIQDGFFNGEIQAGSIMTGKIYMGDGISKNGNIFMKHTPGAGNSSFAINKKTFSYEDTGVILGVDDADQRPKMYLNSATNHLAFNGVDLETQGTLIASTIFKVAIYTVAGLPVPETSVGYNSPS